MFKKSVVNVAFMGMIIGLSGCGGGGSEGYYNQDNNNVVTPEPYISPYRLKFEASEHYLVAQEGSITLTIGALDKNGGGLEGKDVTLSIDDSSGLVKIAGKSKVTTDAVGNAVFVLTTPKVSSASDRAKLINNGITVTATTPTNVQQVYTIAVEPDNTPEKGSTYLVIESSKTPLDVAGDTTIVTVTAVDQKGLVLKGHKVNFVVSKASQIGVKTSSSGTETDDKGEIRYTLTFDAKNRSKTYSEAQFISEGLNFTAQLENGIKYNYKIGIQKQASTQPAAVLSAEQLPNNQAAAISLSTDNDHQRARQTVQVQFKDQVGNPISYAPVQLSSRILAYSLGQKTQNSVDVYTDYLQTCPVQANVLPFQQNFVEIPQSIVSTDENGIAQFEIQYDASYANWVNIQLYAETQLNGETFATTMPLNIRDIATLSASQDGSERILQSPFGISFSCFK